MSIVEWQHLRQGKGQNIQAYTHEFKNRALSLGIPLYTQKTILKYIGGMHSYLRHTILMFNPTNIDKVYVQATHMEASKGKHVIEDKKPYKFEKEPKGKWKSKKSATIKKSQQRPTCSHCKKKRDMRDHSVGNYIQNYDRRSSKIKGSRRLMHQLDKI
jgi:hypothetical protein